MHIVGETTKSVSMFNIEGLCVQSSVCQSTLAPILCCLIVSSFLDYLSYVLCKGIYKCRIVYSTSFLIICCLHVQ